MHEHSVALSIVETALRHAAGRKVESLTIEAGLFSGVFADSLRFYLELLFEEQGQPIPNFHLSSPPARCRCECGSEYPLSVVLDGCPSCGGHRRTLLTGRDCVLVSMEVADA
ncbi:MAG: hydrogenase maturation nickel metallochaperone HypA [Spirochaetes bacterium]|nr:hydrogenase maturation nickel metallochaperone HypA [Spirochaetota bacterium]